MNPHPALIAAEQDYPRNDICVVLIESRTRLQRQPYHRKKLVLLLSAMRHYALELEALGYRVDYRKAGTAIEGLREHAADWQPDHCYTMAASEYGGRKFQNEKLAALLGAPVKVLPNSQFLVGRFDPIPGPEKGRRYVMENFYRSMRRHFDLLMEGAEPVGGQWNFDKENRKPLPKGIELPNVLRFDPDVITLQVMEEIRGFESAVGSLEGFDLAVTRRQAVQAFENFLRQRLDQFGPYEDAMTKRHATLFHSILSPYLNLGLLEPLDIAQQVEAAYHAGEAPINSVEGFIRQVIGWREFMYWQYWRLMPDYLENNFWQAERPLPEMFWSGETDMACLQTTFQRIMDSGYAHHIERLMLLANFSTLAGLDPIAVNNWFLASFIDGYEWVMVPNVIGMGLNADGGVIATKPYIASANYINKMSDHCQGCVYDRKQRSGPDACPFNTLYWHFLIKHEAVLRKNPRMGRNVLALRHLDADARTAVTRQAKQFLDKL